MAAVDISFPIASRRSSMFPEGNVPGYVCNPGSPRERDAASQGHTSGIPTRAMLHSWKLAPAAHHVLLSILVMTSPHLTSGRQFWLITHMIQSWTTLMAFPIASRRSVSLPRGTRVTYSNPGRFFSHLHTCMTEVIQIWNDMRDN